MATRNQQNVNGEANEGGAAASAINLDEIAGDSILVSISGYNSVLPYFAADGLDDGLIGVVNGARKHAAYTAGQQQVKKWQDAGVPASEIPAKLVEFYRTWTPPLEKRVTTLNDKRREIGREMLAKWFEGRGKANVAATLREDAEYSPTDANGRELLPAFMDARKADIDAEVMAFLNAYVPPAKKGAATPKGAPTAIVDDISADDFAA